VLAHAATDSSCGSCSGRSSRWSGHSSSHSSIELVLSQR
jgi:hypothetical protein